MTPTDHEGEGGLGIYDKVTFDFLLVDENNRNLELHGLQNIIRKKMLLCFTSRILIHTKIINMIIERRQVFKLTTQYTIIREKWEKPKTICITSRNKN